MLKSSPRTFTNASIANGRLRTSVPFLDLTFQTDFGGVDPRVLPQLLLIVRQRLLEGGRPVLGRRGWNY